MKEMKWNVYLLRWVSFSVSLLPLFRCFVYRYMPAYQT